MTESFSRNNQSLTNIPVINCLRGIAASMVCFFHFVVTTTGYVDSTFIKDVFEFGKTGVHMFFVISGVVIPLSMIRGNYMYRNWRSFMFKRLARLEPPYLASIILALIYFQVRTLASTSSNIDLMPTSRDLILHIGYMVPFADGKWIIPTFWTLSIEFQYYLVLSLLLPFVLSGNKLSRYGFYLIFLLIPLLLPRVSLFPVFAPLFLMGITYVFFKTDIIKEIEYSILLILCISISLMVLPPSNTIAALVTLIIIQYLPGFTNRILEFLGNISYSLYLLHSIVGSALINLLSHKYRAAYQKPIVIILGYLLSIACAYVFYWMIEKPSQKLSKKIKYTKQQKQFEIA